MQNRRTVACLHQMGAKSAHRCPALPGNDFHKFCRVPAQHSMPCCMSTAYYAAQHTMLHQTTLLRNLGTPLCTNIPTAQASICHPATYQTATETYGFHSACTKRTYTTLSMRATAAFKIQASLHIRLIQVPLPTNSALLCLKSTSPSTQLYPPASSSSVHSPLPQTQAAAH